MTNTQHVNNFKNKIFAADYDYINLFFFGYAREIYGPELGNW